MSLRVLLFVSAALNVLLLGAVIGFFAGGGFQAQRSAPAGVGLSSPRAVLATLPPDVRRDVRRNLARAWVRSREERLALRAAGAEVTRLVEAEPYDADAMRTALQRQREAGAVVVARFHEALADGLVDMTPAQRRSLAEALAAGRRGRADRLREEPLPAE